MVLPDSHSPVHAMQQQHQQHDEGKSVEYAALEAQFFEYNQLGDSFSGFGGYDMMQHQPSEFGLSLDLMNLPPPAYAPHHLSSGGNGGNNGNSSSNGHSMDMVESSPVYQMETMSITNASSNGAHNTNSPPGPTANPNMLQHHPSPSITGSTPSHQIPLPPSPTGSTASTSLVQPSAMHMHHRMHHQHQQHYSPHPSVHPHAHAHVHPHPHMSINTQHLMHQSPIMMSSDLSAGALSSACSSAGGSPESTHRGGISLPSIEQQQKELREPAHGRTGSTASDKSSQRYNPMKGARSSPGATSNGGGSVTGRVTRKRAATAGGAGTKKEDKGAALKEEDHDSDDDDFDYPPASKSDKREEIRKQRIESEQRRRDELREGYRRLKEALPSSNQKSSKVALLDRAVNHVRYMEMTRVQLQTRLNAAEMEMARLRQVNEALMLGTAEQRAAAAAASAAVQAHVQPQY